MSRALTNWAELEAQPYGATFVIGAETAGDAVTVNVQVTDRSGKAVTKPYALPIYLSSTATGLDPVAIPGSLAGGTDGAIAVELAGTSGLAITEADGDLDVVVTGDTGADTVYLVLVMPTGQLVVSPAIVILAD
jgi:hypothetical protein